MTKARRKDIKEAEKRAEKRDQRRLNRGGESLLSRSGKGTIKQKQLILIMCEGENTEPSYFDLISENMRNVRVGIVPIGVGVSSKSLVKKTIKKKVESDKLPSLDKNHFDKVWVAFDRDDNDDFEEAINLAEQNSIGVAFSNQAFEYWLLLHFMDNNGAEMHRDRYAEELNRNMQKAIENIEAKYKKEKKDLSGITKLKSRCVYDSKKKEVTEAMFELMGMDNPKTGVAFYKEAYNRALRICEHKKNDGNQYGESMTTVYLLMKDIFGDEITK